MEKMEKMEKMENIEKSICTCDRDECEEHSCPYAADIYNDFETTCKCCSYCQYQCAMDI